MLAHSTESVLAYALSLRGRRRHVYEAIREACRHLGAGPERCSEIRHAVMDHYSADDSIVTGWDAAEAVLAACRKAAA